MFGLENRQQEDDIFNKSGMNRLFDQISPKNEGMDGALNLSMETLDLHLEPAHRAYNNPYDSSRSNDHNKYAYITASECSVDMVT